MTALHTTSSAGGSGSSTPPAPTHTITTPSTNHANSDEVETVDLDSLNRLYVYATSPGPEGDDLHPLVKEAVEVIQSALDEFGSEECVAISFNGGKDCTVLLHLLACVLLQRHKPPSPSPAESSSSTPRRPPWPPIPSIYVSQPSPFPLMESFVHTSTTYYNLTLHRTSNLSMRHALSSYLSLRPQTKAVMVGTRRADPHGGELEFCQVTDRGWPEFVRVHPVINWRYGDVWKFLRGWEVPYCKLYDQGYTSLGSTYNTHPNPALRLPSGEFAPAYELLDESLERAGRDDPDPSSRARSPALGSPTAGGSGSPALGGGVGKSGLRNELGQGEGEKEGAGVVDGIQAGLGLFAGKDKQKIGNGNAVHGPDGKGDVQAQASSLAGGGVEEVLL